MGFNNFVTVVAKAFSVATITTKIDIVSIVLAILIIDALIF